MEYFSKFFPESNFDDAVKYRNIYCLATSGKELKTYAVEIKQLYGANLVMGCIKYPRLSYYCKSGIKLQLVTNTFTRDRFSLLRSNLYFIDTLDPNIDKTNKLWRVQPIIDECE